MSAAPAAYAVTKLTVVQAPVPPAWWNSPVKDQLVKVVDASGVVLDRWLLSCPVCGGIATLSMHKVTENPDGTVTITPSIRCAYQEKCNAHYTVTNSLIAVG